jgi:hypothetical protein
LRQEIGMSDGVQGADSEGGSAPISLAEAKAGCRRYVTKGNGADSQGRKTVSKPEALDERDKETLARCWHEPRYVVSEEEDRKRGVLHRGYYVPHEGGVIETIIREDGRIVLRDPEDGTAVGLSQRGAEMLAMALHDAMAVYEKSKGEV